MAAKDADKGNMAEKDLKTLELLSLIYEDLDIDSVEERFIQLVSELFSFDRVAFFYLKHKKGMLCGKLCKGFDVKEIQALEIPVQLDNFLTQPLISGFPYLADGSEDDPVISHLGLRRYAAIPIVNKKRIPCWEVNQCKTVDCPAYGNKWVRCWTVAGTRCHNGKPLTLSEKQEKCRECPIFKGQNMDCMEGVLLVDNSISGQSIPAGTITILSIVAHSVGIAINNSKLYFKTLKESIRDDLTGLYNRRYFNERLLDELERSARYEEAGSISLLFADLDHFKKVNDNFGHQTGDAVLVWISKLLQNHLRKSDVVARYGGEEFAILLLKTEKKKAVSIAEELRSKIEKSSIQEFHRFAVTCSFGVVALTEDAQSLEGLVAKADKALYLAKAGGRNRVCTLS